MSPAPTLSGTLPTTRRWTLADVIDFEHFVADAPDPQAEDLTREALGSLAGRSPRQVLRAWLELRRRRAAGHTPGQALASGQALLSAGLWLGGLALGAALAGTWLAHAGAEPINAPLFWMATVGVQLALLLAALLGLLWRRRLGGLARGLQALGQRAGALLRRLPGERRQALQAALARFTQHGQGHARLLAAPALMLTQRFAVAFNLGLLAALLALHLPLVDLRFGWQSSYPVSADQAHRVVQAVAAPWHWALPQAMPTLAEVTATRVAPGQPGAALPADAARAWWPFLALSIAVYGLALRGCLLLALHAVQARRLARWQFDDDAQAQALWRRLEGRLLRAEAGGATLPEAEPASASPRPAGGLCTAMAALELPAADSNVQARLARHFGWLAGSVLRLPVDDRQAAAPLLATLDGKPAPWAVVIGASRDPIVAIAACLRAVAEAAPAMPQLLLADDAPEAEAQREERLALWQRFVQIQRLRVEVRWLPQ